MAMGDDSDENLTESADSNEEDEQSNPEQNLNTAHQEPIEEELHGEEEAPIRVPRNPEDPLPEERDRHWR